MLTELQCRVCELKPQMIIITETWLHEGIQDAEFHLDGYILFRQDRLQLRGGGIAVYVESSLHPTHHNLLDDAQQSPGFEAVICELHTTRCTLPILAVYRSPSASEDNHARLFQALDAVSKRHMECIIVGDFNAPHIGWDAIMPLQPNSYEAELIDVVDDHMLHQYV